MRDVRNMRMARGQRTVHVEPDGLDGARMTVAIGSSEVIAHLTADERRRLIAALGGTVGGQP